MVGRRPTRRLRWFLIGAATMAALWLAAAAGNMGLRYLGLAVPARDPAEIAAELDPYMRVSRPPGEGPFPTALLFSGCDGPQDNMDRWAAMLVEEGWAAIVVDSHGPRNLVDYDVWRLVCAGQLMMGSERAGDVLVSIYAARRMDFVDPGRLVLIGSSHGGWSIMELLVFEAEWRLPFSLAALPEGEVEHPLDGVVGSILVYPYCGAASRAQRSGWRHPAPVLMLLSADDVIAPAEDCLKAAERAAANGVPVETVVFEGVTHGFDQETRAPLSTLVFDPAATAEALRLAAAFIAEVGR